MFHLLFTGVYVPKLDPANTKKVNLRKHYVIHGCPLFSGPRIGKTMNTVKNEGFLFYKYR